MNIKPDSEIASPIRIEGLINRLEDWRAVLREGQIKRRLHLKTPDQIDQQLVKDLRLLHIKADTSDADQVDAAITAIKAWLTTAPVVHLTFSTPTQPAFQAKIVEWFHKQIDPSILVDFKVDGQVAAGFLLRTKNRMFDFSANSLLWQNRGHIAELVKNV